MAPRAALSCVGGGEGGGGVGGGGEGGGGDGASISAILNVDATVVATIPRALESDESVSKLLAGAEGM